MELTMRTATPAEQLYSTGQSMQIKGQTGSIGHLRLDKTADGQGFSQTWKDHGQDLATEGFQQDLEQVLNALANDTQYGGFLNSPDAMDAFCQDHLESSFNGGFEFGFRVDTAQYSYMIRLNPWKREENLFLYCYRRDWLNSHMKEAERGIRFINSNYKENFRIEDGDKVRIRRFDGSSIDRVCRYIDDCHAEIGRELYHIYQFAEIMERNGHSVIPLRNSLPLICYGKVPEKRAIVMFEQGYDGYRSASSITKGRTSQKLVDELNGELGVTKAQAAAMQAGATLGWESPAANPKNYDEQGQPIKFRHRDRGDAR